MHLEFHLLHWNEQQQSLPDCWQEILTISDHFREQKAHREWHMLSVARCG
jgi:hypothetical protein